MIYAIIYFSVMLIALVVVGYVSRTGVSTSDDDKIALRAFFFGVLWPLALAATLFAAVVYLPVKLGQWLKGRINIGKF